VNNNPNKGMPADLRTSSTERELAPEQKFWFTVLLITYYEIVEKGGGCDAHRACLAPESTLFKACALLGYPNDFLSTLAESALLKHKQHVTVRSERFVGRR